MQYLKVEVPFKKMYINLKLLILDPAEKGSWLMENLNIYDIYN